MNLKLRILLFLIIISYPSQASLALEVVYQSDIVTAPFKSSFYGHYQGGQFGAAMATGDFNADGIEDIAVGAPFSSAGEKKWNGSVRILLGGQEGGEIELLGENAGDQFGTSLVFGDFNIDGIDDLAIGAYNALDESKRPGKVYVYYGKQAVESTADLPLDEAVNGSLDVVSPDQVSSQVSTQVSSRLLEVGDYDSLLTGTGDKSGFGISLAKADINNDHFDDLLIGSPFSQGNGLVYGFLGSDKKFNQPQASDVIYHGQVKNERFGSSITAGDLNGDGFTDLAIGAYWSNADEKAQVGKVYIYNGKSPFARGQNINKADFSLQGESEYQWFSFDIEVGNLNGDQYDDLIVSSFPYNGERKEARVLAYYGSSHFEAEGDLSVEELSGEALLGASLLIDDFDLDGKIDLVVGAPGVSGAKSSYEGDVYVFYGFGRDDKKVFKIDENNFGSIIRGENADDWFGYTLASLDFNNDGYKDLAIGSRYSDGADGVNQGKIYVMYGEGKRFGKAKALPNKEETVVNRGELLNIVLDNFNIKTKKSKEIAKCYEYLEFCLFNFSAMTSYKDLSFSNPLQLYPDVNSGHKYFDDINLSTMLGLVNGYLYDENSPFRPEWAVTRIQALKIIFGAADLVPPKYKFELVALLGSYTDLLNQISYFKDVDSQLSYMWWYPRYVNFAVENGIVEKGEYFRPNDNITVEELNDIIGRTLDYLSSLDEKTQP